MIRMRDRRFLQLTMAIGLGATLLLFVLPLLLPMSPVVSESASYRAGYNNTAATYAAIGLSVLIFLVAGHRKRVNQSSSASAPQTPLNKQFVSAVLAASALVYAACGFIVTTSHIRYLGDAGYIIEQATVRLDTGRQLYSQIEFAYGPLLLLPTVWLSRFLHLSVPAAYFTTLVLESTLGLLMVVYLLNAMPIRTDLKRPALLLLALGAITPHLGLNYTFFRFASPFAMLLFGFRRRTAVQCAIALAAGEALVLLTSPELGLAMAAGLVTFGLLCPWQSNWRWAATVVAPLLTLVVFLITLGQPFFHMVKQFSAGALNLPIGPYPHILIFLPALLWFVPFGLGRLVGMGDLPAETMSALFVTAVALTRAALGRSDPLHVFFDGFGIILLSLVVASRSAPRTRTAWIAAFSVLVVWTQYVNQRQFLTRTKYALAQAIAPSLLHVNDTRHVLPSRIEQHLRLLASLPERTYALAPSLLSGLSASGSCVSSPLEISPTVEQQLRSARLYAPGYYAFGVDAINTTAEERMVNDANQCNWMLLPSHLDFTDLNTTKTLRYLQGVPLPYRERYKPHYLPGQVFLSNLSAKWVPLRVDGPYTLYRRSLP